MFSRKRPTHTLGANATSLIARGTRITGDISFEGSLFLDGNVDGQVIATEPGAQLIVGEHGSVRGDMRVPAAIIHGCVCGDVYAMEKLELATSARITGDIYYRSLVVAGAQVNGRLHYCPAGSGDASLLPMESADAENIAWASEPALKKTVTSSEEPNGALPNVLTAEKANDVSIGGAQDAAHQPDAWSQAIPRKRGRHRATAGNT